MVKSSIKKELGLIRNTPLNQPIAAYVLVYLISTLIAVVGGRAKFARTFFYILKYFEYFFIFFLVAGQIQTKKQIRNFLIALFITCAIVAVYASFVKTGFRATAPFEGPEGEPNTLGGYLIVLFAVAAGIALYSRSFLVKVLLGSLCLYILIPFAKSLSRGSYLAFIPMYLTLLFFTKKHKKLLIVILVFFILLMPVIMPQIVRSRIEETFRTGKQFEIMGERITLDESAAARIGGWKKVLRKWPRHPIIGYGAASLGVVDTQYPLVLGEVGILGLWIFMWLMFTILRSLLWLSRNLGDDWPAGLSLGIFAATIGLFIHAFSANTFIIVRIMEPFWFLLAVAVSLPRVLGEEQAIDVEEIQPWT